MKNLTILGIFALFLLLVIPGAVSAADVTVSGSILPDAPVAAFTATPTFGAETLTVEFIDASTPAGYIDTWTWEYRETGKDTWIAFNDIDEQNPTQDFNAGYYDIRLTVTNDAGSNEKIMLKYIRVSTGPLPLETAQSGTVSGDLYFSAVQPTAYGSQPKDSGVTQEATFEFAPSGYTTIEWARFYTMVYVAGQDGRECVVSVSFDGNNDGDYETVLEGAVILNTPTGGGNGNVWWQGDHINRVYSDYLMFYDVKDYIEAGTVKAKVVTAPGASDMDGRIKYLALVVAYNDDDSDQVKYWVNDGHHWNNVWTSPVGTDYDTSALTTGIVDAQLRMVHASSTDASYTFNGVSKPGANPPHYFGVNTWDVKGELPATLSKLEWTKSSGSQKVTMAMLKAKYTAPTADFSADKTNVVTGETVTFSDTSTGSVTSWEWDFDNDGEVDSTEQNPTWAYTTTGKKTVKLTVNGPLGDDSVTKTDITVGDATIEVTVNPATISFGTMAAGDTKTGSTTVNVDVTGGTAWSVTGSASNDGYMSTGTVKLANPFQLSKTEGSGYKDMTSNFANFLTGSAGEDGSGVAYVKQIIDGDDGPGAYSITLTFTGGFDI